MALYEKLSATSSPEDIAAAYKEFTGLAGGDTADVQKQAVDYLSALGIGAPAITQAYDIYNAPPTGGLSNVTSNVVNNGSQGASSNVVSNAGALTQAVTGADTSGSSDSTSGSTAGALDQASSNASTAVTNPYDLINKSVMAGDYAGLSGIVSGAGLTANDIKDYYGFGDTTMNWLKSQGVFGTPTSTVSSTVSTDTGGTDTTSGLSTINTSGTGSALTTNTSGLSGLDTTGTTKTYTQDEVNQALADTLSTDPNANRNDVIAAAATLGITADQVNTAYNNLASTSSASGYTKSTLGLNGVAGQGAIEGDDIQGQMDRLGTEYASWSRDGDFMVLTRKDDGAVIDRKYSPAISDLGLLKTGLSFVPGAGQVLALVNVADAIRNGDLTSAAIGLTGLGGFKNVNTALRVLQGLSKDDALGVVTALAGNQNVTDSLGLNNVTVGNYTAKDALSAANLVSAANNGQWASVISNAGNLVNSPDTVLAGRALAVMQAAESGNLNALNLAVSAFNSAIGGGSSSTAKSTKVDDSVPLTAEEIADLNEDQLRVYQESGVAGLRDYNRAIKNLTSLSTTGLTGDYINDVTTGTSTTRSLTGTGALSTAGTLDDFENSEITRLRGLGMSNAEISAYLENLNNLTASLDSTDTSGLSDFGLAAFRQAKAAGATDLEAMAAANLAISGKYPTGTEVVVTDRNATEVESLPDTGSEMVVTSGKETGQETQRETETEFIITSGRETGQETERETETELIITSGKETEKETETEIIVTSGKETFTPTEFETETETITEIVVTTASETETETETITEIIVTTSSETETDTLTEIIITDTLTETITETETETLTEIIVTTSSETFTETETETITEIIVTDTRTETETETITRIYTQPPPTKPPTKTGSFTAGTPAQGGKGKPTEFLKENLLKTYMTKDSFKDPLAQFNKARQELMKDDMMQQGVDPRLAAILAAKMNGDEPPPAPSYNYGEEPASIDDILGLKVEGEQTFAQGGYVQPLMASGGMALPLLAAKGGLPTHVKGREDFRDGKHVAGEGDGQSDDIPAMLADGEFVFPADVVSALGNGSTKAGTDKLYEMMHSIRSRARSKGPKDLPPPALKSPLDYLKKR